jgi:predicted dehydrogenase
MSVDVVEGTVGEPAERAFRWGICGTGRIAARFVAGLAEVPDAVAVAVASRTPARAEAFAREHGVGRAHGSWSALAADDGVDVVYVAVTQDAHLAAVREMLRGGRHVLCEKPLALWEGQASEMFDEAVRADRFLMEAMWSRFSPAYRRMGELLDQGAIGEVLHLQADLSLRVAPEEVAEHRLYDPRRGGGALLDVGIYPLQLASSVFGSPTAVTGAAVMASTGVDEQVGVVLRHSGGRLAVLSAGIAVQGARRARLSGSEGAIVLDAPMHAPRRLLVEREDATEVVECDPPGLWRQVPEVHRCIRAGLLESPVMSWAESRSLLHTTDVVRDLIGLRYPGE